MKKFENVKVGTKVWSPIHGHGAVHSYSPMEKDFPVYVVFDDENDEYFTSDGHLFKNTVMPMLFYKEQNFIVDDEPPEPEIDWSKVPVNTDVLVKGLLGTECSRKFCFKGCDGFVCFNNELTSVESTSFDLTTWEHCRIHPDVKIKKKWFKKD